jgi:hypothetical protein
MRRQFKFTRGIVAVAVLLAVALVYVSAAAAKDAEPGKERWPIKTSLPADADVDRPREVQLAKLILLEDPPGVKTRDKRYQAARIPFVTWLDFKEGDIISTTGWLHLVAAEPDGDYHIQLSNNPTDGNHCLIVEVPKDEARFVESPQVRQLAGEVREFIRHRFLKGKELSVHGIHVVKPAEYVKVTGQLFFDDSHVTEKQENQNRGKKGMKAKTLWEIHPVTKIEAVTPPQR